MKFVSVSVHFPPNGKIMLPQVDFMPGSSYRFYQNDNY